MNGAGSPFKGIYGEFHGAGRRISGSKSHVGARLVDQQMWGLIRGHPRGLRSTTRRQGQ